MLINHRLGLKFGSVLGSRRVPGDIFPSLGRRWPPRLGVLLLVISPDDIPTVYTLHPVYCDPGKVRFLFFFFRMIDVRCNFCSSVHIEGGI